MAHWKEAARASEKLAALYERAETLMRPSKRLTPDEWAQENRIYPPSSGLPGPRNPHLTPYMVPFARAVYAAQHKRVVIVTSAQAGKTEAFLDVIGSRIDQKPVPMLYAGPTQAFVADQFEPRLSALLTEARTLAMKVSTTRRSKKSQKWVGGVKIRLAHGGSSAALKSDPFGMALVDEYDEMLADVKGQGDPLMLIEARGDTYADFTVAVASTPSKGTIEVAQDEKSGLEFWAHADFDEVESAIWGLWQAGTRHHWCWPCPHCNEYFVPRLKQLHWPKDATPSVALTGSYLSCPRCGGVIEEEHKAGMNERGRFCAPGQWITPDGEVHGDPPESSTLSFWVSGLASPFRTFGQRAEAYLYAMQTGEQEKIQTAINAGFGECSSPGGGDVPEWQEVFALRRPYARCTVPDGVRVLTAGVDVQQNRLVYAIRGWGARQESWLIDYGELWGDTGEHDVWLDLVDLLDTDFDGFRIRKVFIDSGYKPKQRDNVSSHKVYEFCRDYARVATAAKGFETRSAPVTLSKVDVTPKGEKAKWSLQIALIDTDYMKSFVHQRIRWPSDQPGGWHLNMDVTEDYCRQIVAEARLRKPNGKAEWVQRSRANHALDAECLAFGAAHLLRVYTLRPAKDQSEGRAPTPAADAADDAETEVSTTPPRSLKSERKLSRSDKFAMWAGQFNS